MRALVIQSACAALLLGGCSSNSAMSLVVITVDADAPLNDVATLHGLATVGSTTREFDVHPSAGGSLSIPPAQTLGLDIPHTLSGTVTIHVDAIDSTGAVTASGDGSGPIRVGARADLDIHLTSGAGNDLGGAGNDLGGSSGDMAGPPGDMVVIPPAMLTVDKTTQSFGDIVIGKTSTTASFLVTNAGGMDSSVVNLTTGGANLTEFTIDTDCGPALPPGGHCHVTGTVTPTTAGMKSATFSLAATQGGTIGGTLTANALTPGAVKILQPSGDCGSSLIGTQSSTTASFTVQNSGSSPTTALTVATSDPQFTASGCSGTTLDAGAMCTVTVKFTPSASGTQNASLTVSATTGGTDTASLVGVGLKPAALKISPTAMTSFTKGQTATFTVTNSGDVASSALATAAISGGNAASFTITSDGCKGTTVGPSPASCMIAVKFVPTTTGTQSAVLSTSATTGGSLMATLGGPGLNPAMLVLTPDHYAFPATARGSTSGPTVSFTLTNSGDVPSATLSLASISGAGMSQFAITSDGCQSTQVGPAPASCAIVVQFSPTTTGTTSATLNINTTSATAIMAPLTATATPTWTQEALSLTLPSLNAVWAADATHVFAVGQNGTIVYRDPTSTWSLRTLSAPAPLPTLTAVTGYSATSVLVAGTGIFQTTNDSTWSSVFAGSFTGAYVTADSNMWASYNTGKTFAIYRSSTSGWSQVQNPNGDNAIGLAGIWGTTGNDVYTFGAQENCGLGACSSNTGIFHPDSSGTWTNQYSASLPNAGASVTSLWGFGSPANTLYATAPNTSSTPLSSNGNGTWTPMGGSAPIGCDAVWGSSASAVWFGCENGLYLYDGSKWTGPTLAAPLIAGIYGTSATNVYAVGEDGQSNGLIYHYY